MNKILSTFMLPLLLSSNISAADAEVGKAAYNTYGCAACHGLQGVGTTSAPRLNDKTPEYIVQQLEAFQNGARVQQTMNVMSKMVEGKEADIAKFLVGE